MKKTFLIILLVLIFLFLLFCALVGLHKQKDYQERPETTFSGIKVFADTVSAKNILLLGMDKSTDKNTDTIMLAKINPADKKIDIISIPRDTKVNVGGTDVNNPT